VCAHTATARYGVSLHFTLQHCAASQNTDRAGGKEGTVEMKEERYKEIIKEKGQGRKEE
jgi:hypothetical protein